MGAMKSSPRPTRRVALDVFVSDHCWQCAQARTLAQEMALQFPALAVTIVNLDQPDVSPPSVVFAVPTFLLDQKIISLGTPTPEDLGRHIAKAMKGKRNERRKNRLSSLKRSFPRSH